MSKDTIEEKHHEIWEVIKTIKTGMLTTRDGENFRSRPMQLVQKAYEGTIWFFTSGQSAKVFEAMNNPEVNVTFAHPDQNEYISLSGIASISRDRERIDAMWSKGVEIWFPEGKNDDVALLKIDVYMGERWSAKDGTLKKAYEFAKAALTGSTPDIGKNEKFAQ